MSQSFPNGYHGAVQTIGTGNHQHAFQVEAKQQIVSGEMQGAQKVVHNGI